MPPYGPPKRWASDIHSMTAVPQGLRTPRSLPQGLKTSEFPPQGLRTPAGSAPGAEDPRVSAPGAEDPRVSVSGAEDPPVSTPGAEDPRLSSLGAKDLPVTTGHRLSACQQCRNAWHQQHQQQQPMRRQPLCLCARAVRGAGRQAGGAGNGSVAVRWVDKTVCLTAPDACQQPLA